MPKFKTTEQFIEDARAKHGDRYDYSRVVYERSSKKVEIVCLSHGSFWQTPNDHLTGHGCPGCSAELTSARCRKDSDQYIEDARGVHGDKYDYSRVVYVRDADKIEIICPRHGSFWQTCRNHLNGEGCIKCSYELRADAKRETLCGFIEKANSIHDFYYDYSKSVYVSNAAKIEIVCPKHGSFWQTVMHHLKGCGCKKCSRVYKPTTEEFVNDANVIHKGKYDYSRVVYVNMYTDVEILCPLHGPFKQSPTSHIHGKSGCPECGKVTSRKSNSEILVKSILDNLHLRYMQQKSFKGCKNKLPLYFDFQVFTHDGFILLEVDGIQHTKPIDFFGGKKSFNSTRKNDEIKNKWARQRNITLHRLNHEDLDLPEEQLQAKIIDLLSTRNITKTVTGKIPITLTTRIRVSEPALQVALANS